MSDFLLLDCTLRDGGYINGWKFGHRTIKNIIRNLIESRVDYIEIGFLRNCDYDVNKTLFNNIREIKEIVLEIKGNTLFSAMALHDQYDIEKLEPYDGSCIDIIRVTFHDYDIDEGIEFCKKIIAKGYQCFCNPINIMGYSDRQIMDLIDKVNTVKPYAFSIVDTFGSMMKEDLQRIYLLLEHNLNKSISIGLHLHENLALSFSLAQEFIHMCVSNRKGIIDASLMGMGRVPGNLALELIMDYMNKTKDKNYDINPVLEAVDDFILPIRKHEKWGYSTAYALSAKYNLHRNYSEFLLEKGKLKIKQINQILSSIPNNKKTVFNKGYIDNLYVDYQNVMIDDQNTKQVLLRKISGNKILILASGRTLSEYKSEIDCFIQENSPFIISANFDGYHYPVNLMFFSNLKRYEEYAVNGVSGDYCITSNIMHSVYNKTNEIINYYDLICNEDSIVDNCVLMLIKLLSLLEIKSVTIAGFDGFSGVSNDYVDEYLNNVHKITLGENERISNQLNKIKRLIDIKFLTPTYYGGFED